MLIKQIFTVNKIEITENWFYTRLANEIEIYLANIGKSLHGVKNILINYKNKDQFSDIINGYEFTKITIYIR